MKKYDYKKIEKKWQKYWADKKTYKTKEGGKKPKCYVLDMFPYPSGEGLHVGHPRGYIATDVYSRFKRMNGFNVLHPMGFDSFGLPAENYAIKNKIHPEIAVKNNVKKFKKQLEFIGFDYDWEREIITSDPNFYKWTQWIFLKMFEKGLAYESYEPINFCPSCLTGLANEDVEDGKCERCATSVVKKPMRQWVLKITDYAERMLEDLDELKGWPEHIKEAQRNWIGKSEGTTVKFPISNFQFPIEIFTTRIDTIFGVTYLVLAPEHSIIKNLKLKIENFDEVSKYIEEAKNKSELQRTDLAKEKTGVELKGVKAINPANGEELPVWTADYVLAGYGTGAIMAVPAHDDRDFEFAKKYNLPISNAVLVDKDEAIKKVNGKKTINYKLKDWVFSRQRYWGEPIPLVFCENCAVKIKSKKSNLKDNEYNRGELLNPGWIIDENLPVKLPKVKFYEPTDTGESPLAKMEKWVNVKCPKCGGKGKRETNTMPQWAGSSWYCLAYIVKQNSKFKIQNSKLLNNWLPVDMYVGGTEHATRHLIYARFWHKFLYDIGVVEGKEPFAGLKNQGLIMGNDGRKMSKRWGNIVNPDDVVLQFGADTLRVYEMFMGPFDQPISWNTDNMAGSRRFLERVYSLSLNLKSKISNLKSEAKPDPKFESLLHKTIKKISEDIENFHFNTAISALMILLNEMEKQDLLKIEDYKLLIKLLSPFAPHIAEELWSDIGGKKSIHLEKWPEYDESKLQSDEMTIIVQVNGKVRGSFKAIKGQKQEEIESIALSLPPIKKWVGGNQIKKIFFVKGKVVSILT
ncbi:MAG: leucyl-tRNA synthetase [Parcubacteria group bacterium]|nr:leucyl-tRNA synthetase [Parcubacteria group bacterium]